MGGSGKVADLGEATERIRELEQQIRSLGVSRLAVFGFLDLSELLELELGRPVELVTPEALTLSIGKRILAEARDVLRAA